MKHLKRLSIALTVAALMAGCSTGVKLDEYMREIVPFYVALGVTLAVTTFYPPLSLVLANWVPM